MDDVIHGRCDLWKERLIERILTVYAAHGRTVDRARFVNAYTLGCVQDATDVLGGSHMRSRRLVQMISAILCR